MEENYTLSLALVDYLPSIAFGVGAYFLTRFGYSIKGKLGSGIMALGSCLVFIGGLSKATWKLLLVLYELDSRLFDDSLFILQAPGFCLMLIASITITRSRYIKSNKLPVIALWKVPLLAVVTISSLGMYGTLASYSYRNHLRTAGWFFVLTIIIVLGMSGMASWGDQTIVRQWIEEGINTIGQLSFAMGSIILFINSEKVHIECVY